MHIEREGGNGWRGTKTGTRQSWQTFHKGGIQLQSANALHSGNSMATLGRMNRL